MIDILKSPAEGSGGFVCTDFDVADQLSGQVSCRSEDPASDDIALDFGKPDLDLIKPAGIGRGVMDSNRWIGLEELENSLGFMCAQVVSHDVNLAAPQADWRRSGPESRQTRPLVWRAVVFAMTSPVRVSSAAYSEAYHDENTQSHVVRLCRGERPKPGQGRFKCLDSALLIDTEDRSVYRRLQVEANDVGRLLFKLGFIASQ